MQDFTKALEIESLLQEWNIEPNQNFEEIFSDLYEKGENQKLIIITENLDNVFLSILCSFVMNENPFSIGCIFFNSKIKLVSFIRQRNTNNNNYCLRNWKVKN